MASRPYESIPKSNEFLDNKNLKKKMQELTKSTKDDAKAKKRNPTTTQLQVYKHI